jgi:peptidoglycan glycosyltransferase
MNRFIQSAYIPGSVFKIVTLAAALEENPAIVNQNFLCTGSYKIGNEEITCESVHDNKSLKDAFRNSCNCAFAQIAQQLGGEKLQQYVEKFGVIESVSFDGIATQKGNFKAAGEAELNVAWSSIGQHLDLVNPCAFMTFVGAVANDGRVILPHLIGKISVGNNVTYQAKTQVGEQIMSVETAKILQEYMKNNVVDKYGAQNFPGLTVGAKTGTGEVDGQKPNATLAGFVDDENLPLVFMVCVEDAGYGKDVCIPIVSEILEAARTLYYG